MKKVVIFFLAVSALLAVFMTGRALDKKELDFKSMRDAESGAGISLGDSKEDVDALLGEPVEPKYKYDPYIYSNGLKIKYSFDDIRTVVYMSSSQDNFEILGYKPGMSVDDAQFGFASRSDWLLERPNYTFYNTFYNDAGDWCLRESARIYAGLTYEDGDFYYIAVYWYERCGE